MTYGTLVPLAASDAAGVWSVIASGPAGVLTVQVFTSPTPGRHLSGLELEQLPLQAAPWAEATVTLPLATPAVCWPGSAGADYLVRAKVASGAGVVSFLVNPPH